MATGDSPDQAPALDPNEPITLSDPDGAITRVAPWSTWTREQVRAPGGEPSLVTHLLDGQLWFAAGRTRSPWNHEIRVGTISVSTPEGRFHVSATEGGGATVSCLAGRARIVVDGDEPTVLRELQTAAISSGGDRIVVTQEEPVRAVDVTPVAAAEDAASGTDDKLLPVPMARRSGALTGLARVAAIVAIVAVAAAALALLLRDGDDDGGEVAQAVPTTDAPTVTDPPTTEAPSTTESTTPTTEAPATTETPATTEAPATTEVPATTAAPSITVPTVRSSPDAVATGQLERCKRGEGTVVATVDVRHRSGGPGRFRVEIGLIDRTGRPIASGRSETTLIENGQTVPVEVSVPVDGPVQGACELVGVTVF